MVDTFLGGIFRKVWKADAERLRRLRVACLLKSEEGVALNTFWIEKYGYSLRVQLIFDFIERLKIPSGRGAGGFFKLNNFQKAFIADIYNPLDKNGLRIVKRAILSIGRKNGKTMLTACLVIVHLFGPEAEKNGEIFSAANSREQASKVFQYATQIIRADEDLIQAIEIVKSTRTMICKSSIYRAVAAEAGTNYGENPSLVIYDELSQAKNRELYDAFDTSMGARDEPLFIVISTQSKDPLHILSQLIDDGLSGRDPTTVCHLYAVPDDADDDIFTDRKLWGLANPALGGFRSLSEMGTMAKRAIRMPTFEASFRNLYLNQRVDASPPIIPRIEWEGCKDEYIVEENEEIYLGLDLSGKTDLTALVGVTVDAGSRVLAWFWKPEASIRDHEVRDRVPYTTWVKQGFIATTPGRTVQYDWVVTQLAEIAAKYTIKGLAFDRWRIDNFKNDCDRVGLDVYVDGKDDELACAIRMVPWGQGYRDMAPAIDELENAVLDRTLQHDGHPCLTWNISNAMGLEDAAGNRKMDKSASRFRIDGAVALAMAVGLKSRDLTVEDVPSCYEERGVLTF